MLCRNLRTEVNSGLFELTFNSLSFAANFSSKSE